MTKTETPTFDDRVAEFVQEIRTIVEERPGDRSALRRSQGKDPLDMNGVRPSVRRLIAPYLERERRAGEKMSAGRRERAFYTVAALMASQPRERGTEDDAAGPAAGLQASGPEEDAAAKSEGTPGGDREAAAGGARTKRGKSFGYALARSYMEREGMPSLRELFDTGGQPRVAPTENRLHMLCRQDIDGLHRSLPGVVRLLRSQKIAVDWARLLNDLIYWGDVERNRVAKEWMDDFYTELSREYRANRDRESGAEV